MTARDVTERRRQENRIERLSKFDELTGAMRRGAFLDRLGQSPCSEEGRAVPVFALNLRRFTTINATLGRDVGDAVLRETVKRLEDFAPDLVDPARLGGDVFAIRATRHMDPAEAAELGRALKKGLCAPYIFDSASARIGVSVGVAFLGPGDDPKTVLERSELALDEARKTDSDIVGIYSPSVSVQLQRARRIERAMWPALDLDQFFVAYQPQIRISDLRLVGAEALVRWRHPEMGMISPGEFIGVAEASGFIEDLGRWVLNRACADAAGWPADLAVAVNVSPTQFRRGDVVKDVREAIVVSGLQPKRLQLEITESVFMDGSSDIRETLDDIRMMGVALALDDFGAGFSSFGYLARLPIDKIKADQMFARRMVADDANCAILRSINALAQELGLKMVCEGVETQEQLAFLRTIGCSEGQGYLFGKPMGQQGLLRLARPGARSGRRR